MQSVRHARRCTELGGGAGNYTQPSKINERKRVPVRLERSHQGRALLQTCMEMTSQLVEKDQQWNFLIRMTSKKYEIKKQVIGEDPDLEKGGRILNRVIEWNRDGVTNGADQRHVREILKGLGLERANRSATPCALDRRDEGKGESRHGQDRPRLSTSGAARTTVTTATDHRWQTTIPPTA